jgi:starch synthase (maltosyl-transferring)
MPPPDVRPVPRTPPPYEQVVIESVRPSIDGGRFPAKAMLGEDVAIDAIVFRHGHERVQAALRWRAPGDTEAHEAAMALVEPGIDRWRAELRVDRLGKYRFTVLAWTDVYQSWVHELQKRVLAEQPDVASEIAEGLALLERVSAGMAGEDRAAIARLRADLMGAIDDPPRLLELASAESAHELLARVAPRDDVVQYGPELVLHVERPRAGVGAWYELFVRSQGSVPGESGTFQDAARRLPDIKAMGFDVVYLAPIHPIGHTSRKGPNNRLDAVGGDPGSPWAIGSEHGGHTAIEPALGTLEDFDRFVAAAAALDMEVALDFAIQCSPDHPWVRQHPDWFYRRPDGTIRYAENPPKKYQDVYPLNFDTPDWRRLWDAWRDVVRFWVERGVRIFRVDNPHTKPIGFWTWLIDAIQASHPDVVFLAEAFTRPPMMQALAKRGFSQSYTYFTWRNTKAELVDYLTELTTTDMAWYFRPNFFANTPDILPPLLQTGGPPAFKSRMALAATLSPSYGIYSGFELCEHAAVPGREEYLDSEKYEIKIRDWDQPGHIKTFITRVNRAREENAALRQYVNLAFLEIESEALLAYMKWTSDGTNAVIIVVNLDPLQAREAMLDIPDDQLARLPTPPFGVDDLITGERYTWGARNYVRLDPIAGEPVHILRVAYA